MAHLHSKPIILHLTDVEADLLKEVIYSNLRYLSQELDADKTLIETSAGMSIRESYQAMFDKDLSKFIHLKSIYSYIIKPFILHLTDVEADLLKEVIYSNLRYLSHELDADKTLIETSAGMSIRESYQAMFDKDLSKFIHLKSIYSYIIDNKLHNFINNAI